MAWRMLRYLSDIRLAYRDTRVHQHLIYIGKERLTMPAGLDEADIRYGYGLIESTSHPRSEPSWNVLSEGIPRRSTSPNGRASS